MRLKTKMLAAALFAALTSARLVEPIYSQTLGAASSQFMSRGPGAEAAAMAGSVVSDIHDPTALYWNPAGLADAGMMISGEHLFLVGGARYDFMGLSVPSDFGSFGFGVTQLARDNIVARSAIDDPGYDVSNTQSDYMAGFAKKLGRHWSAGISANVLDFNLAGYSDMGWGLDAGVMGHYEEDEFMGLRRVVWLMGADLKNIAQPQINLAGGGAQPLGAAENYPRELFAGGGLSFQAASRPQDSGIIEHDRGTILFSLQRTAGDPNFYPALGFEYSYLDILIVRIGFDGSLTGGIGLHTEDDRFELDYSLENDPLGLNNRFTLAYRFSSQNQEGDKDQLSKHEIYREVIDADYVQAKTRAETLAKQDFSAGEKYFNDQEFSKASYAFRVASILNPNDKTIQEAYRRARKAERILQIRGDEADISEGFSAANFARDYVDIFELLNLRADNQERLLRLLRRLISKAPPNQYEQISSRLFKAEISAAKGLENIGRLSRAERVAQTLQMIATPLLKKTADDIEREITDREDSLKSEFNELSKQDGGATSANLAKTALDIRRAFPDDSSLTKQASLALGNFRSHNPLSIRESFYLKKLYYLAAADFARKTPGSAQEAEKYLHQILSDNPIDENADSLLADFSREESGK
jgi:hypothetical protein